MKQVEGRINFYINDTLCLTKYFHSKKNRQELIDRFKAISWMPFTISIILNERQGYYTTPKRNMIPLQTLNFL